MMGHPKLLCYPVPLVAMLRCGRNAVGVGSSSRAFEAR